MRLDQLVYTLVSTMEIEADHVALRIKFGCSSADKAIPLQRIKGNFCKNCSQKNSQIFYTTIYCCTTKKTLLDV